MQQSLNNCSNEIIDLLKSVQKKLRSNIIIPGLDFEITFPQMLVLHELYHNPGISLNELSDRINLSKSTVSGIVDRLEASGSVIKAVNTRDKRSIKLSLSRKALQQTEIISKAKNQYLSEKLATLAEEDINKILEGLKILNSL